MDFFSQSLETSTTNLSKAKKGLCRKTIFTLFTFLETFVLFLNIFAHCTKEGTHGAIYSIFMYEKQAAYILILMMYLYILVLMLPSKLWLSLCACLCFFVLTPQCWRGRCCPSAGWAGARIGSLTCPRTGEPPLDWIYWQCWTHL